MTLPQPHHWSDPKPPFKNHYHPDNWHCSECGATRALRPRNARTLTCSDQCERHRKTRIQKNRRHGRPKTAGQYHPPKP